MALGSKADRLQQPQASQRSGDADTLPTSNVSADDTGPGLESPADDVPPSSDPGAADEPVLAEQGVGRLRCGG